MGTLQGTNKYPIPVGTFESMIFGTSAGGICDPSLEGNLYGMGVSKNRGTPKYMVYKGKTLFKMDDLILGVPLVSETSNMGVSENGGTPKKHPKMIIFSIGKPMVVGVPLFSETSKKTDSFLPSFSQKIPWQVQKGCAGSWHGFIHGHGEAHVNVGHFGRIPTKQRSYSGWCRCRPKHSG